MKSVIAKSFLVPLVSLGFATAAAAPLEARLDKDSGTITVHRDGLSKPLITQPVSYTHLTLPTKA